jgi:hypothetical protein
LTWVSDHQAHVLEHSRADEPAGTSIGLACPDHGLELGAAVDDAVLRRLSAEGEVADLVWTAPAELAAGHGVVSEFRSAQAPARHRLDRFCPVKPQRWVIASFEHHPARTASRTRTSTTSSSLR